MTFHRTLCFVLIATAVAVAGHAAAAQLPAVDQCVLYGFAPGSRDYALCRMNVRRYWTTGPCASGAFAAIHRRYCHLDRPLFI